MNPDSVDRSEFQPLTWLLDRGQVIFGQLGLWFMLAFAIVLATIPFEHVEGIRAESPATIFSWIPEPLLRSNFFFLVVRAWLAISALLWAFHRAVPWSSWSTVFSFALLWSLRMENVANGAHIFNVTNTLLFVHAAWFHFYRDEIRLAWLGKDYWSALIYPRWAFWLSLFYIGWFHTLAGFTKIAVSGPGWGDGLSLQLWVNLFGNTASPFAWPILESRTAASVLQTTALVIECCSVLCIFGKWPRYIVGFGLIAFYTGVLGTFTMFGFHFNWFLVFWFLLPIDRWLGLRFSPAESLSQVESTRSS